MFRNMKISVRLIISSVIFLIPVGMMLFLIVTNAASSLQTARFERRGLESLRCVAELFQAVSTRQLISTDEVETEALQGQRAELDRGIEALLAELERGYGYFLNHPSRNTGRAGPEHPAGDLIRQIRSGVVSLKDKKDWEELAVYSSLAGNLRALAARAGSDFSLVPEKDAAGYYLAGAGIRALPRSLERIFLIGNLLRLAQVQESFPGGSFSAGDREAVEDYLSLFSNSDYPQALSDMDAALACLEEAGYLVDTGGIYRLIVSYRSAAEGFAAAVRTVLSLGEDSPFSGRSAQKDAAYAGVFRAETAAAEQSYELMSAAFDQLDVLLQGRIDLYRGQLIRSLLITLSALVLSFAVVLMTNISIAGNTRQLQGLFKALADNDLSAKAVVQSGDEFGEFMTAFNGFLEELRVAFDSFNQDMSLLSSAAFDLSSSTREISTTANQQSASVAEILSTMEGNKDLSAQGAAKTQEVADLALKTQELSRRGADLRDANQDMMGMIRDQNGKIITEINSLADMLVRINESIAIIDSIADQTRLIAFNASLEAAASVEFVEGSAGESARFSVVAAEIRRFADNVVDSTTEIKEQILEVQQASRNLIEEAGNGRQQIDQGYERMVKQKEVFEQIVEVSQNVADRSRQISALSKQQEYASSQIFTTLKEISAGVNQFVAATASTSRIAGDLNIMSAELRKVLEIYRTGNVPPLGKTADKQGRGEKI
ncbi:MAG: methyl-accepting chemotaxis protein [Treponema sp.]|jgi:methyl-accepting chemotaxis protein|nr:methyl-accepting chemotaxis protein [Treponema sp.]